MGWIAHSDANAFYASVELLHRPALRDKPVVVGGAEESRHGIVLAKNQFAKEFGIKTGVSLMEARRHCPDLITLPPNYQLYLKYARMIREIYADYSHIQEAFGLDESWIDLSANATTSRDAVLLAEAIRARINKELGITVSIGLSWNKIYSKLGSDYRKPDACTLIDREHYKEIVYPLPASDLLYVGPATTVKLSRRQIHTIGDIVTVGPEHMKRLLGKVGEMIWTFASGLDLTPVHDSGNGGMKSIGNSSTFPRDLVNDDDVKMAFYVLAESVAARLRENGFEAGNVQIYLRGNDLSSFERQIKLQRPTFITSELVNTAMFLFEQNYHWQRPLRSLGIRGTDLKPIGSAAQVSLFVNEAQRDRLIKKEYALDYMRRRFGYFSVQRGILLGDKHLADLDAKKDNVIHPVGYQYMG